MSRDAAKPQGRTLEAFEDRFRNFSVSVQADLLRVLGAIHRMCKDDEERDKKRAESEKPKEPAPPTKPEQPSLLETESL